MQKLTYDNSHKKSERPKKNKKNLICQYFSKPKGCSKGNKCEFLHEHVKNKNHRTDNPKSYTENLKIPNPEDRKQFLSNNFLQKLIAIEDPYEIIKKLTDFGNFLETIDNSDFSEESNVNFVRVLSRICKINSDPSKNILKSFLQSSFIESTLPKFLKKIPKKVNSEITSKSTNQSNPFNLGSCLKIDFSTITIFFNDLILLFNECLYKFRSLIENLPIDDLRNSYELLLISTQVPADFTKLKGDVENLKKDYMDISLNDLKNPNVIETGMGMRNLNGQTTPINVPINYKEVDLILTKREIWENRNPFIEPHRKNGTYDSWERYFNTLFYLVREDCYRSLRKCINLISSKLEIDKNTEKMFRDIYYYKSVMIESMDTSFSGIQFTLSFEIFQSRINWNKRLLHGSLVILTPEDFSNFLFGVILEGPEKNERGKKVRNNRVNKNQNRFFCKIAIAENNFQQFSDLIKVSSLKSISTKNTFHMFESKAYYESYRHILKRIQDIDTRNLPFEDVIINYTKNTNMTPLYMNRLTSTITYGMNRFRIFSDDLWPQDLVKKLDKTQFSALKHGLRNKIAIIQGPPGTGKTYVGGILTQLLLNNISTQNPILVVCYTNHALDQFLTHISKFEDNIVRIGGKCNDENIKMFALAELRKNGKRSFSSIRPINLKIKKMSLEINNVTKNLDKTSVLDYYSCSQKFPEIVNKIIEQFLNILYSYNFIKLSIFNSQNFKNHYPQIYAAWINRENLKILLDQLAESGYINNSYVANIFDFFKSFYENFEGMKKIQTNLKEEEGMINNESGEDDEFDEDLIENLDRKELDYYYDDFLDINDYTIDINSQLNNLKLEEADNDFYDQSANEIDLTKLISSNLNMWMISQKEKLSIIQSMKRNYLNSQIDTVKNQFECLNNLLKSKKEIELFDDINIIKSKRIVGMTTTGCAKYSSILEQVNFQTIIIEEAAEVLESHITALLTRNIQHLILIGDHQQLKPNPFNYEIAKKFNFDLSLFERLINNNVPKTALGYQRRMRPEFADFVRLIYSTQYLDHLDTYNRPNLKGINSNLYFINHKFLEEQNSGLASKTNPFEAKFLSALAKYFTQQGYSGYNITILATYIAQVLSIKEQLKIMNVHHVRVCSVDNYQGEENDIILLSLVRSNKENHIGFLKSFNRICVAFSRAKLGFFVTGNFDCIIAGQNESIQKNTKKFNLLPTSTSTSDDEKLLWTKIYDLAIKKGVISDSLTFKCQKHDKITIVKCAEDFKNIPEGGCKEICKERLECGHVCEYFCHNFEHDVKQCAKPCQRDLPCGHKCTKKCNQICGSCKIKVRINLPICKHESEILCEQLENVHNIRCNKGLKYALKCSHEITIDCYDLRFMTDDDINIRYTCNANVKVKLPCGHEKEKKCSARIEDIKCYSKCDVTLPCNHKCKGTCNSCLESTLHLPCVEVCKKILICSHECEMLCSNPCICSKKRCDNVCDHGHCNMDCSIPCWDCNEPCSVKCDHHKCKKLCSQMCEYICNIRCTKKMKCGHQCIGLCGEKCPNICRVCDPKNSIFDIYFGEEDAQDALFFKLDCNHIFEVNGLDTFINLNFDNRTSSVQVKACPNKCKNAIKKGNRYRNVLKQSYHDVQEIKKKLMEAYGDSSLFTKVQNLFSEFMVNKNNKTEIDKFVSIKYTQIIKSLKKNKYAQLNTAYNLGCNLNMIFEIEKYIESQTSNSFPSTSNSHKKNQITNMNYYYDVLFGNSSNPQSQGTQILSKDFLEHFKVVENYLKLDPEKVYSEIFLKDLNKKIVSLYYYVKCCASNKKEWIDFISKLKFSLSEKNIKLLKDYFKDQERKEMLSVINAAGGKWYRCPDGHYYSVGECGRPMEETKCPDCKKKIGGRDHVPNQGNQTVDFS